MLSKRKVEIISRDNLKLQHIPTKIQLHHLKMMY